MHVHHRLSSLVVRDRVQASCPEPDHILIRGTKMKDQTLICLRRGGDLRQNKQGGTTASLLLSTLLVYRHDEDSASIAQVHSALRHPSQVLLRHGKKHHDRGPVSPRRGVRSGTGTLNRRCLEGRTVTGPTPSRRPRQPSRRPQRTDPASSGPAPRK